MATGMRFYQPVDTGPLTKLGVFLLAAASSRSQSVGGGRLIEFRSLPRSEKKEAVRCCHRTAQED